MSTFLGFLFLVSIVGFVVWLGVRHLRMVADGQPKHVHRPIVVADGTVDICGGCGELINR